MWQGRFTTYRFYCLTSFGEGQVGLLPSNFKYSCRNPVERSIFRALVMVVSPTSESMMSSKASSLSASCPETSWLLLFFFQVAVKELKDLVHAVGVPVRNL